MAQVKFYKINNSTLSSLPIKEGQLIFVQDTGKLYIDKDNSHRVQVDGVNYTGSDGITVTEKNITNAGVRAIATGATNGTISVNTNGTSAEVSVYGLKALAYKDKINISDIDSGTLAVNKGGTGTTSFTSGEVLVGNGTSAIGTKAIDTTSGGTSESTSLITSGAVYAGLGTKLNSTLKGANNGLAELDSTGKVPSSQLPSYVDDVLEYANKSSFPSTGETGKIYIAKDTNLTYRWSGTAYVEISASLALGETDSTAYRGDRGKIAYDHSQSTHARTDATKTESSSTNGNIKINGTETTVYTHPAYTAATAAAKKVGLDSTGHVVLGDSLSKSDVGLGNVGNFKAVSTVANQGLSDTEKSNARANIGAGTSSLTLGTTSSTAYRGDRGNTAYTHATDSARLTTATASGLYKVASTAQGHIASLTAVEKADITALGIPAQDTTYSNATTSAAGLMSADDKTKLNGIATGANKTTVDSSLSGTSTNPVQNKVIKSALDAKIGASDVVVTPVQASGATVGTIKVGSGEAVTLYAPQPGAVATELATVNQTYYLTGVQDTAASSGSQVYNTRMSNTFTGLKYQTSTSSQGGSLFVDDREVTLGLNYEIS